MPRRKREKNCCDLERPKETVGEHSLHNRLKGNILHMSVKTRKKKKRIVHIDYKKVRVYETKKVCRAISSFNPKLCLKEKKNCPENTRN